TSQFLANAFRNLPGPSANRDLFDRTIGQLQTDHHTTPIPSEKRRPLQRVYHRADTATAAKVHSIALSTFRLSRQIIRLTSFGNGARIIRAGFAIIAQSTSEFWHEIAFFATWCFAAARRDGPWDRRVGRRGVPTRWFLSAESRFHLAFSTSHSQPGYAGCAQSWFALWAGIRAGDHVLAFHDLQGRHGSAGGDHGGLLRDFGNINCDDARQKPAGSSSHDSDFCRCYRMGARRRLVSALSVVYTAACFGRRQRLDRAGSLAWHIRLLLCDMVHRSAGSILANTNVGCVFASTGCFAFTSQLPGAGSSSAIDSIGIRTGGNVDSPRADGKGRPGSFAGIRLHTFAGFCHCLHTQPANTGQGCLRSRGLRRRR